MPFFESCRCEGGLLCLCFCLLCLLCEPGSVCAQSASPEDDRRIEDAAGTTWAPSLGTMGQDALDILRAPARLNRSQQFVALGASGVVYSAMAAVDRPVYHGLNGGSRRASAYTRPLAAPGRWYDRVGPDRVAIGTAGLLAAGGLVMQRPKWTHTSVRVVEAVVFTKLVTGFAKGFFSRSRPFVGAGPFETDLGDFDGTHTATSMPSGHTARAFAVASVVAHQFDNEYVSALAYGGAASVGLERVRSGDHWVTDVALGAAIGYFIGQSVSSAGPSRRGVRYAPILSTEQVGLQVQF